MAEIVLTTEKVRRLLTEKFPPTNDRERVYGATLVALSEVLEKLNEENNGLRKLVREAIPMMTGLLVEHAQALKGAGFLAQDDAPDAAAPSGVKPADEAPTGGPRDKTPFPAGLSVAAASPTAPPPKAQVVVQGEDLTPNASSGPATNPVPISKKPPAPNGATKEG